MGGVNSAKEPDSSVGGVPVVNCLGVVHMEEEVQYRSGKRRARDRRDTRKGTR